MEKDDQCAIKGIINMKWVPVLLIFVPCIAGAAHWKKVFEDYEYVVSIDTDSIERSGESVRSWVQQRFIKRRLSGADAYNILNGLNSFDCKSKKVSLVQVDVYLDDKAVASHKAGNMGGDRLIIPGTVEYFAYRNLCPTKKD